MRTTNWHAAQGARAGGQAGMAARTLALRWRRLGLLCITVVNQLIVLGYQLGVPPATLRR